MKTKDLMIGDWVKFPFGNEKIIDLPYIPGKGICASFAASATLFPVEVEKLRPIPLTPEILEKNGFVARYAYGQKKWHIDIYNDFHRKFDDNGDITLNVYSERKMEWRLSIDTDRNERTVVYIRFVHELQHALRLCGIEKEVVL